MSANKQVCPEGCHCGATYCTSIKRHVVAASFITPDVNESDLNDVTKLVATAREHDHTTTSLSPLCQVICEIGPGWTSDLIKKALGSYRTDEIQ